MKIYRIAKHTSDHSHSCIHCGNFLKPQSFSRNSNHHFPWGIVYTCGCGKSGLWTNSIRGPKEFMDVVFKNVKVMNSTAEKGFCNDLFCPFCLAYVQVLKNGLEMDSLNKPAAYANKDNKEYYVTDYDKYITLFNTNSELVKKHNPECMGKEAFDVVKSVDVCGCRTLKHNLGIIMHGSSSEYGEAQYRPIYAWIKANKNKIPEEMIEELKSDMLSTI